MNRYSSLIEESCEDYEEKEAIRWMDKRNSAGSRYQDTDNASKQRTPNEVWMLPTQLNPRDILGEKESNLVRIAQNTHTHMRYNEEEAKIEMWGGREELNQALKQWNAISNDCLASSSKKKKKKDAWAKADKPLSDKQRKRRDRKAKQNKDYRFRDYSKAYAAHFYLHDPNIDARFVGDDEAVLDPIRAETKSHVIYDPSLRCFTASSDSLEAVEEAVLRTKNLYLKVIASRSIPVLGGVTKGWIYRMISQPKRPVKVKISLPPDHFKKLHDVPEDPYRIFVLDEDDTVVKNETIVEESDTKSIYKENVRKISQTLEHALGIVHLFDEEIKMRIRFGHLCLMKFQKNPLWSVDRLNNEVLGRIQSKFATCLATKHSQLDSVSEALFGKEQKWRVGKPYREFKIFAIRPFEANDGEEKWECTFDVQFRSDNFIGSKESEVKKKDSVQPKKDDKKEEDSMQHKGDDKIGLWNATTDKRNVLEINMICLDYDHSWQLSIQTSKRLPNDKFSPQGIFVHKLRLSPTNRLIYTNTDDVKVTTVCEKMKYKYWWKEHYIVEITRYVIWDCKSIFEDVRRPGIECVIEDEHSKKTSWGVTLYKQSWLDTFAENCSLKVGKAPEWHPTEILEDFGGIENLLKEIDFFLDTVLHRNIKGS